MEQAIQNLSLLTYYKKVLAPVARIVWQKILKEFESILMLQAGCTCCNIKHHIRLLVFLLRLIEGAGVAGLVLEYLSPDEGWLTTAAASSLRELRERPASLVRQVF